MRMRPLANVLPWLASGASFWFGYQLLLQNGRILLQLDTLERQRHRGGAAEDDPPLTGPTGLPPGMVLQDFELRELSGGSGTLTEWRGRRVLLIFFDPECGFCQELAPRLLAHPLDSGIQPVVISTGGEAENARLFAGYERRFPVLLQEGMEVADLFVVPGTPMGYLVDEQRATVGELAVGAEALLALLSPVPPSAGRILHTLRPPPETRHIQRDGLEVGTAAPAFRLPRLDGTELALEDYAGRQVLLVFSDPDCAPCDPLLPDLEAISRKGGEPQVLMVSRGGRAANLEKVERFGLTFPIVLQQHWEISRAFGIFATPVGYLIDTQGIIAAPVAVGREAICDLARHPEHANR